MVVPARHRRPVTVIVPLPPSYRGGTEEYAYQVARRLSATVPVRIVTTTVRWDPTIPAVDVGEVPLERLEAREVFQRPWLTGRRGLELLRSRVESSSLVQLHMPFPFVERRVAQWAERAGVPTVLTYHMDADFGGASRTPGAGLVTFAYRRLSAFPALSRCARVISNSMGYARASPVLSRYLGRVRSVGKGVDVDRLGLRGAGKEIPPRGEPGSAVLPGSEPSERRVLFVGRLVPYKGVPVLLRAVAEARRSDPGVRLYVAGRGPEEAGLRRQSRELGLESVVRFLGFVPDATLSVLYRSVDVVACPSISPLESTATALEESAAVGTPILGSDLPGASESLPNDGIHGLLVPPGNVPAVAGGLLRLLHQPRPSERLPFRTWDDTTADYLAVFRELGVELSR